jgi:hypothetical protein
MGKHIQFAISQPAETSKYNIKPNKPAFYNLHPYFSFRYFHKDHDKFNLKKFKNAKEFIWFFERLQKMSADTWEEIFTEKRDYYHAHEVDWEGTDIKKGFCHLPKDIQESPAYQFKVFEACRVLGFFNHDNVFKIIWIDREHQAYPSKKK